MAQGDKTKYSAKQKRQAEHIEEGYEEKGLSEKEAKRRAWATVNKVHGGGTKGGSGSDNKNKEPMKKGGNKGGAASSSAKSKTASSRSRSTSAKSSSSRKSTGSRS